MLIFYRGKFVVFYWLLSVERHRLTMLKTEATSLIWNIFSSFAFQSLNLGPWNRWMNLIQLFVVADGWNSVTVFRETLFLVLSFFSLCINFRFFTFDRMSDWRLAYRLNWRGRTFHFPLLILGSFILCWWIGLSNLNLALLNFRNPNGPDRRISLACIF